MAHDASKTGGLALVMENFGSELMNNPSNLSITNRGVVEQIMERS